MTATEGRPSPAGADDVVLRPAQREEIPACGAIWREALNDYMGRLNLPPIPEELGPIGRLHAHLHATDPERFLVAARASGEAEPQELVGFGAATRRDDVWFLSMLFVRPADQGRGIGRALLERLLPDDAAALGTGTDSAQPVSNALYATLGMVPRMPLLSLVGRAERVAALGALPGGIVPVSFHEFASGAHDREGHHRLVEAIDGLDREVAGFSHPQDHRFLRLEGRQGFLYLGPDGAPVGYGYSSELGRIGPVAVREASLLPPVLGHLLTVVPPRDAQIVWVPGHAGNAVEGLLRAGLRLDGFPVLLCWDRSFADFSRYLPISPGLL